VHAETAVRSLANLVVAGEGSLRPEIQIEAAVKPLRLPLVERSRNLFFLRRLSPDSKNRGLLLLSRAGGMNVRIAKVWSTAQIRDSWSSGTVVTIYRKAIVVSPVAKQLQKKWSPWLPYWINSFHISGIGWVSTQNEVITMVTIANLLRFSIWTPERHTEGTNTLVSV
jgi:hypothetical protein